jgi:hypothetical protein
MADLGDVTTADLLDELVQRIQTLSAGNKGNGDLQHHAKRGAQALSELARALSCAKWAGKGYAVASVREVPERNRMPYCDAGEVL